MTAYANRIKEACELYEIAEALHTVRYGNSRAATLSAKYFVEAMDMMNVIADEFGKDYSDVLVDVREISQI